MSAAGHRHIENLDEIAWYRARFPDKGAGVNHTNVFIQADSEEAARAMAADNKHFDAYDTSEGTVNRVGPLWSDIRRAFMRAGGPNILIDQLGNVKDRSDL